MIIKYFKANWCSPCKHMLSELEDVPVPFDEINIDDNIEETESWNVKSVPTLILLDDKGEEVSRCVGYAPANVLKEQLGLK